MKVAILAGGLGSRLAEETEVKPKPMVEIGEYPILWHIMKHYWHYGFKEFFIALGHKGEFIKRFFSDYYSFSGSVTMNFSTGNFQTRSRECEDWIVHLMETGKETMTGGRIKRLESSLKDDTFMVTYGDGVADINLRQLLDFHRSHGRLVTITAVRPPARFGGIIFDGDMVSKFTEKPQAGEGWINGGFIVCEPGVFDYLKDDSSSLEADAMEKLAMDDQLAAFRHDSFWQCMDTLRDLRLLESLWKSGNPPWKIWE
jgi:glucose-1-phosphate cytidylyltransferase